MTLPYLWLMLFFVVPFVIVLKISFSDIDLAIPPYKPLIEWVGKNAMAVKLNFNNYAFLFTDPLYIKAFVNSIRVALTSTLLCILIVRLLISSRLEFAYVLFSPQYRAQAAEHAAITRAEAARTAAIPGPVACSNLVVCRMAGKPFVYDHFYVTQLFETGRTTLQQVDQYARRKAIVKDNTKEGAYAVFVVDGESSNPQAKLRPVTPGAIAGDGIQIASGLSAGEQVIVSGAARLRDGERITVIP